MKPEGYFTIPGEAGINPSKLQQDYLMSFPKSQSLVIVNNSDKDQNLELFTPKDEIFNVHFAPFELRIIKIH